MPVSGLSKHELSVTQASLYTNTFPDTAVVPVKINDGKVERVADAYGSGIASKFGDHRGPIGLYTKLCKQHVFYRGDPGSDPFPKSRRNPFAPVYRPLAQTVPQFSEPAGTVVYILRARAFGESGNVPLPPGLHRITDEILHLPTPSDDDSGPRWLSELNPGGFDRDPFSPEVTS